MSYATLKEKVQAQHKHNLDLWKKKYAAGHPQKKKPAASSPAPSSSPSTSSAPTDTATHDSSMSSD